ncbi:MAG: class I SAM-dependent methyltransferase [Sedimentisphaerales bacterium]|jgi:ubiquinone/menaquinone biosynthesis C-methylase UbiE
MTSEHYRDILDWDVENWSKTLPFWMEKTRLDLSKCYALDIGAYNGGISLFLALNGANVVCSDVKGPTKKAKTIHEKYDVASRISYASVDALAIPFPDNSFDLVTFKSVMGDRGTYCQREKMMREIYRVLKPHGELWFAENLRGSALHMMARTFSHHRTWHYFTANEIIALCEPFSVKNFRFYGCLAVFGRYYIIQTILGKIDRFFDAVIPSRWKYILFGVVKKGSK